MSPTFTSSLTIFFTCFSTFASATGPVSLNFGTKFFGSDGLWSAAQVRVGTPQQYVWTLPSTVNSENWIVGPDGCDGTIDCQAARGGLFYANQSSSYQKLGRFELGSDRLGLRTDYGDYGMDTISVSDKVSVPVQMISTLTDPEVWLGQIGLNVQETQFSDHANHLSLIASMVRNGSVIPSHSYGYTAGAQYSGKGVPGSLVLGGTDTTRYTPNNVQFSLSTGYFPKVAVTSITVGSSQGQNGVAFPSNWMTNPATLLQPGQAAQFTIDSSTPLLWMPAAVCDTFASLLNLTYNDNLQLYMFSNKTNATTTPQILKDWGLTFTFSLANSIDDSTAHVTIPISYNAFNLQLYHGYPGSGLKYGDAGINYFPLRRANSSDQYTIGRAFLQEAYLTVEYEKNSFSISPALFPDVNSVQPNLVALARPAGSKWPGPDNGGLSVGAKAGIAIVIVLLLVGIAGGIWFFLRRRKRSQQQAASADHHLWRTNGKDPEMKGPEVTVTPINEMTADRRQPGELLVDSAHTRFELAGPSPIEMAAGEVPDAYLKSNQAGDGTLRAELGLNNHSSIRKDYNIRTPDSERAPSPALPPYSPNDVGRNIYTRSLGVHSVVSPCDSKPSPGFGSHLSSAAISPVTAFGSPVPSDASPTSTEMQQSPNLRSMASSGTQRSTHSNTHGTNIAVPTDMITRTTSQGGRFREDLVNEAQTRIESPSASKPPLRPRYSWEQ